MIELRQSNLRHIFDCEQKYILSKDHDIEQTKPMKMGNIFESFVFDEQKESIDWDFITKGLTKTTIDAIKSSADKIRPIFKGGVPFKKLRYKSNGYILSGEADYIGMISYQGKNYTGIVDLKLTGSITKIWGLGDSGSEFGLKEWDGKCYKHEFLQSFAYPYMLYKTKGKIYPFYYLVVESGTNGDMQSNAPLTKLFECVPTIKDFAWFEKLINKAIRLEDDPFIHHNYSHCLQCQYFKSRKCRHGINKFSEPEKIHLSELEEL